MHIPRTLMSTALVAVALGLGSPVMAQRHRGGGGDRGNGSSRGGGESHAAAAPRASQQPAPRATPPPAPARLRPSVPTAGIAATAVRAPRPGSTTTATTATMATAATRSGIRAMRFRAPTEASGRRRIQLQREPELRVREFRRPQRLRVSQRARVLLPRARSFLSPVLFVPAALQSRIRPLGRVSSFIRLLVLRSLLLRGAVHRVSAARVPRRRIRSRHTRRIRSRRIRRISSRRIPRRAGSELDRCAARPGPGQHRRVELRYHAERRRSDD